MPVLSPADEQLQCCHGVECRSFGELFDALARIRSAAQIGQAWQNGRLRTLKIVDCQEREGPAVERAARGLLQPADPSPVLDQVDELGDTSVDSPHRPHEQALANAAHVADDDVHVYTLFLVIAMTLHNRHRRRAYVKDLRERRMLRQCLVNSLRELGPNRFSVGTVAAHPCRHPRLCGRGVRHNRNVQIGADGRTERGVPESGQARAERKNGILDAQSRRYIVQRTLPRPQGIPHLL